MAVWEMNVMSKPKLKFERAVDDGNVANARLKLSVEDSEAFAQALLSSRQLNAALHQAMLHYQRMLQQGKLIVEVRLE